MYCINYSAKNNYISTCMSSTLEKKDGMIITDDFIFIKEIQNNGAYAKFLRSGVKK